MILKYYLECKNPSHAKDLYMNIFDGKLYKEQKSENSEHYHANMKLYDKIPVYICNSHSDSPRPGYIIISFSKDELKLYEETLERIRNSNDVRITLNDQKMSWGWRLTEFLDKFGYYWDIEIEA